MTAARLAARCVELLGVVEGPIAVVAPSRVAEGVSARLRVASGNGAVGGAICVFLGERVESGARGATLDALAARLASGAPLVVVDHNQPRAWWRRALAIVLLALRGFGTSRARHPVAREVQERGFTVERLRLASGERTQLVLARRR